MNIISLNVNGLRAFYNREYDGNLIYKLLDHHPDILAFQEIKCDKETYKYWLMEFDDEYDLLASPNTFKPGYAGVGLMINKKLNYKEVPFDYFIADNEYDSGRVQVIDLGEFYLINVYVLNSGNKDDLRSQWNFYFEDFLWKLDKPFIAVGDFNVCSRKEDCYCFEHYFDILPGIKAYEIDHFNKMIERLHLIDGWIHCNPSKECDYTWYSYRGGSRYNNQGFRLDYALLSESLKDNLLTCEVLGSPCEYSDHSPLLISIK